jgi:hypothetical protein
VKRLILTTSDSGAGCLRHPGVADAVIPFGQRFFLRERLPPEVDITNLLAASSLQHGQTDDDWLLHIYRKVSPRHR